LTQSFGDLLERRTNSARNVLRLAAITLAIGLTVAASGRAESPTQNTSANAPKFEFEVATIKPSKPGSGPGGYSFPAGGFKATNVSLQTLVEAAYRIGDDQVLGAPKWLNSDRYDVEAKMDASAAADLQKLNREELDAARQQMLQAFLADRLMLTIHRETKEFPVYLLVISKNGPKLQEAKPGDTYADGPKGRDGSPLAAGNTRMTGGRNARTLTAHAVPISSLTQLLLAFLGRPVLDKTGLVGKYDFTLTWGPDDNRPPALTGGASNDGSSSVASDSNGPPLLTALQEQLGLKLESGKGPLEVIVIDHVERPSGN
jgi:uncharacterized protein (TIGR03435 family)